MINQWTFCCEFSLTKFTFISFLYVMGVDHMPVEWEIWFALFLAYSAFVLNTMYLHQMFVESHFPGNIGMLINFGIKLYFFDVINCRFFTTETNLKALYIFILLFVHNLISKAICSECTDFCLQLCFSETFHILKMKAHFEKEPHFENESSFWNPFWKWKQFGNMFIPLCCQPSAGKRKWAF